ncbi:uncharacterized mitochondrial protein-like protein [Tanacetum coccineum]
MDIKSAFLYRNIKEEVYVCQPPGFEDPDFHDKVYKVEKARYGLHQAPRAWYKGDILLVQVYVDDIIFGSTKKELCIAFEKFTKVKTISTLMETQKPLLKDEDSEEVDVHMYRSMIGSLMYLTSSRPDIMFAVCAYARYQVNPKVSHLYAVKRIFRYLKGQPNIGLWYPKDYAFDWVAYTDSDYARASLDRKSTTGGCQFLECRLISWQCKKQTVVANSLTDAELYLILLGKAKKSVRLMIGMLFEMELELMLMIQRLIEVRAATTASSLEAEQDSGGASNMGDTITQTRFERVSKQSNDSLLARARVESSNDEESLGEDASKKGRINAIDADEENTLVSVHDANVSAGEEVFVKEQEVADEMEVVEEAVEVINTAKLIIDATQVSVVGDTVSAATTTAATNVDDITLAQALEEMKSTIHAERGVVYKRWGESTTTKIFQKLSSQLFQRYIVQEQRRVVMKKLLYVSTTLREKKNSLLQLKEQKRKETNHQQKLTEGKNNVYLPNEHEGYKLKFENSGGGGKRDEVGLSRLQENTIEAKGWKRQRNVELKQLMEIIPDEEEVSIDSIPLAVKSPNLHVGREEVSPCTIYTFNDLEKKLMIDYESETAYHLLKFIVKQLKK